MPRDPRRPVQFRIGALQKQLGERVSPAMGEGVIAKRDLTRYYELIEARAAGLDLSETAMEVARKQLEGLPQAASIDTIHAVLVGAGHVMNEPALASLTMIDAVALADFLARRSK